MSLLAFTTFARSPAIPALEAASARELHAVHRPVFPQRPGQRIEVEDVAVHPRQEEQRPPVAAGLDWHDARIGERPAVLCRASASRAIVGAASSVATGISRPSRRFTSVNISTAWSESPPRSMNGESIPIGSRRPSVWPQMAARRSPWRCAGGVGRSRASTAADGWSSPSFAARPIRWALPVLPTGTSFTNMTRRGTLWLVSRSAANWRISSSVALLPAQHRRYGHVLAQPRIGDGESDGVGDGGMCEDDVVDLASAIFTPPRLMISLRRPLRNRKPSSSNEPRSPVRNQPSTNAAALAWRNPRSRP